MKHKIAVNNSLLNIYQTNKYNDRPTIIFLHDSLGCIDLWRNFPDLLGTATNCNVLVYDRLGYGKSDPFTTNNRKTNYLELEADGLNTLLEQLNLENVILFGHSDGGSISLIAAAKYPSRIKGIITEGAHIFVEDITLKGIKEAVDAYHTTNLKERLERYHGDKTDAVFWAWANTWLSEEFHFWNIEHFLPLIKCPTLIIQGENDEYGSLDQVNKMLNEISGQTSKLIIPSAGHTPHKEAQQIVLEHSMSFLNRILSGNF